MSTIIRFGIDLAKNTFATCGVDEHGKIALKKPLARGKLLEFFANAPPALVAMEAGSGAHHWARELIALGHDARIIDPRLVAPYRQQGHAGKNDFNDAMAICEAAGRPRMRFIPRQEQGTAGDLTRAPAPSSVRRRAHAHREPFARLSR
jgi:transposase